jgi:glycosyltransferase involved in cell wall biosynthesis
MRKFRDEGHDVYIVTPTERRLKQKTTLKKQDGITLLKIKILNIQKTSLFEKGISTLLIEHWFLTGIKKNISGVRFDMVLYSTPPITFTKVVNYIKRRDKAKSYLLLKDIFPQNAIDLGMIKKGGLIHRYFRHKEKRLYLVSDFIGCMSLANVDYLIKHNPEINPKKIEVNPNSIEPVKQYITEGKRLQIRDRYNIPLKSTVFIYGGNLGKPQGIDFLISVLDTGKGKTNIFFMVVGSGTEFPKIQSWFSKNKPSNATILPGLPKNEYDQLIQSCDVGMIFLDRRFTIPNFPSRLLSYLEYKMPVIAATDPNTDLGKIIEENEFGYWVESGNLLVMNQTINKFVKNHDLIRKMGQKGFDYMQTNYTVLNSSSVILNHFKE